LIGNRFTSVGGAERIDLTGSGEAEDEERRAPQSSLVTARHITDQSPDDFSPGQPDSTCFLSFTVNVLGPGDRCTMIIGFEPSEPFAGRERADITVTAADSAGKILRTRHVRITGVAVPAN
jgi:hypothetical protein